VLIITPRVDVTVLVEYPFIRMTKLNCLEEHNLSQRDHNLSQVTRYTHVFIAVSMSLSILMLRINQNTTI
jgi:hypothetical protein